MKINVLVFGLLISAVFNLHAQEKRFGILAGFGITEPSWPKAPIENIYKPIVSYSLNAHLDFKSKGIWGLSIEPGIIQKGSVIQNSPSGKRDNERTELLYIHAPLLSNFYLGKKFMISFGPEFGYLISGKRYFMDTKRNITDSYEKFEVCGLFGLNYKVSENIVIGIRYSRGLIYTDERAILDMESNLIIFNEFSQYLHFITRYQFNSKNKG